MTASQLDAIRTVLAQGGIRDRHPMVHMGRSKPGTLRRATVLGPNATEADAIRYSATVDGRDWSWAS